MKKNIVWGIVILGIAGAYLLEALGVIADFSIFKVALMCFFGGGVINGIYKQSIFKIVYSSAFLYYFGAEYVGLQELSLWTILVFATLLQIGLVMIFGKKPKVLIYKVKGEEYSNSESLNEEGVYSISTSFGATKRYITSENFTKCNVSSSFGEAKVYFENAKIIGDSATVNVSCNFGEVKLYIPKNWNVDSTVSVNMGEFKERNNVKVFDKTLKINGSVNFGEVKIYNI